ncbi:polymorphic toxin-type HINT domain-containing protein [Propionibacterium australiense]|uniref:polymorphic toxin-type HINT domain-containing protein n=1 Tax=Propionibacterium australiense TaxID=119981 RepID=UPI000F6B895B|nr:polymorphic toxin-type HINT domain-containing protein [Propionibacterium australiense]VEH89196.1 replicative DNA helicase [Propionibacterium australiense]
MFLSADPLEPVTGAAWAANPYSYAGNDPVGSADPLGLRPVSEEDLRAYQQASNGMLQNAAGAVTGWVSENWEYIAAGAMVVAGFAVMCTGVGGPIGAAMMAGALTSAGGSIWSQKSSNGSVDWGTVLRDGAVGAATRLIGGGASAAAAKATAGMANCLGKNIVSGAVEGAIDGGASNGLQYLTSGQPITVAGFARAVGEGAGEGALGGGASGALSKVTGVSRYGCFTADTPVVMADGTTKRIDQVEVGEEVLAHDPATGEDVPATVERTFVHENVPTLRVTTTEGCVETTATHPFYVEGRGYTPADQLHEGDTLHTPDGQTVQVVSVQATGHTQTVHNLAIGGLHNYHVATNTGQPILVHNQTKKSCDPVEPYEVGTYDDLKARSVTGDGLDIHHVPQAHAAEQVIDGYDRKTGTAIALPRKEHAAIPTKKGIIDCTPEQQLTNDINDLRKHTQAPSSAVQEIEDRARAKYGIGGN